MTALDDALAFSARTGRRVFFIASRIGSRGLRFPAPTHRPPKAAQTLLQEPSYVTVREAIADLPRLDHGEGEEPMPYGTPATGDYQRLVRNGSDVVYDHVARRLAPTQLERLRAIRPGQRMADLPEHLRTRQGYGGAYSRLDWDEPALTITTWVFHPGSGRFGHPEDDRTITMREAARIQSFDDDFRFTGSYNSKSRQIGNAVPPLLAQRVAEVFREQLGIGPAEAQRRLRLDRAATLLARTNLRIQEVADETGFANPFHFTRAFRTAYGCAPREFRQRCAEGMALPGNPLVQVHHSASRLWR